MGMLTNAGETACLTTPGFTALATKVKLYSAASAPLKNGTGFVEVTGGSYASKAITSGNWTTSTVGINTRVTLANQAFTASGSQINSIAGLFLTDSSDNVLAWWPLPSTINVANGATYTFTGLYIGGSFSRLCN